MKIKLLFIDDDESFLMYAKQSCKKIDLVGDILFAHDGMEGLDIIQNCLNEKTLPKIIFVDVNMPKMNGFEFLIEFNKLKSIHSELERIFPIAMLTSSGDVKDQEKANQLGVFRYLIKGNTLDEFRNAITECINVTNV